MDSWRGVEVMLLCCLSLGSVLNLCLCLVRHSGKLQVLDRLLDKLLARGHRVVLFSQFTTMLGILQEYCDHKGFK